MLDKKTRIGFLAPITWGIPPKGYGPWEQDVADLITGLKQAGYENIVLFATKESQIPGVKTIALVDKPLGESTPKGAHAWELLHISYAMERASEEVDILNNHLNFTPLLFHRFLSIPMITTLHGAGTEENSSVAFEQFKDLPYISISDAERKILPDLNYVATVYNPVDFHHYTPSQHPPKEYLVNMGRMHPHKGVHNAIALAKKVGLPLYLAGPIQPEYESYFTTEIAPHIDNKHVHYLGNLSGSEVKKWVSEAKAFIGLVEWDEPFGRSIAEAMACGTPVIGTARGAHPELIIDGKSGLLVHNTEEAIARFSEVEKINRHVCRETVQKLYSIPAVTQKLLTSLEKVLSDYPKK